MLHLCLPQIEVYDSDKEEFVILGGIEVDMEYSLYTISLWESKWKKPFMTTMTTFNRRDEIEWFKCMCLTPNVPDDAWLTLTTEKKKDIYTYMTDSMTATTVNKNALQKSSKKEIVTSEIVYYWMTVLNIPFECEHWHFNKLMKLIEVCFIKQAPPKKMGKHAAAVQQRDLNALRRAKYNSKG